MSRQDRGGKRVTVSVEELALKNSVTLTALVQLLEERGILRQTEVPQRMRRSRDKEKTTE